MPDSERGVPGVQDRENPPCQHFSVIPIFEVQFRMPESANLVSDVDEPPDERYDCQESIGSLIKS